MSRLVAAIVVVTTSGCSLLAREGRIVQRPPCDEFRTKRRVDYAIGGTLLGAATYAASRPSFARGTDALLGIMLGMIGTMVSMPFLVGAVQSRDAELVCFEQFGSGTGVEAALAMPSAADPGAAPAASSDADPLPSAGAPFLPPPPATEPASSRPETDSPPVAPATPAVPTAPAELTSKPYTTDWTAWLGDRELADKVARSSAQGAAYDACTALQASGPILDQLRLDSPECEQDATNPPRWRCRYVDVVAVCQKE